MTSVLLIIIAVLLFGLIIFIHEFGHFFTAKLCGVRVNEFAMGMGPQLFSFKKGETQYSLRLFPIGGYCAMEGEDEESSDDRAFGNKPVWKRMLVVVMGAVMNIVLGLVLMGVIVAQNDLIATTQIANFSEGSKLEAAGAMVNDTVVSIDGYRIYTARDLSFALGTADPQSVDVILDRNGEKVELNDITLDSFVADDRKTVTIDFNVYGAEPTVGAVIKNTFTETYSVVRMVLSSLKGLVTGQFGLNEVSGPIGAAQSITQAASAGLEQSFMTAVNNIIIMMVLISVNLGIFNLLPFPALDGGRFVFLIIEGIRKKPIPQKYEAYVNGAGFVILIILMIIITIKDVLGIIG